MKNITEQKPCQPRILDQGKLSISKGEIKHAQTKTEEIHCK